MLHFIEVFWSAMSLAEFLCHDKMLSLLHRSTADQSEC